MTVFPSVFILQSINLSSYKIERYTLPGGLNSAKIRKEELHMKTSLLIKLVIMFVAVSSLSACLLVPMDEGRGGHYEGGHGGEHHGDHHEGGGERR